jgi:hypothetical protein
MNNVRLTEERAQAYFKDTVHASPGYVPPLSKAIATWISIFILDSILKISSWWSHRRLTGGCRRSWRDGRRQ